MPVGHGKSSNFYCCKCNKKFHLQRFFFFFFLASSIKPKVAPASRPGIRLWLRLRCAWCPAAACGKVALGQVCKWLRQPQPQPDLFGFQIDELSMKPLPPPQLWFPQADVQRTVGEARNLLSHFVFIGKMLAAAAAAEAGVIKVNKAINIGRLLQGH